MVINNKLNFYFIINFFSDTRNEMPNGQRGQETGLELKTARALYDYQAGDLISLIATSFIHYLNLPF